MRKSKNKHRPVIIVVLILVIFVVACGGYYFYELTPISDGSKTIDFAIQEGESYDNVLNNLEKKGLIRSARIASLYSKIHTQESYYAGDYEINNGMNTGAVLQYISNVKN
ncbi:MAG: endolytic transglycosylase MltG, partial [Absicoccus porci]